MLVDFFLPVNEENFTDFFPTLSFVSCAPQVEKDSPAWQLLAEKNSFDIELYEYILELFEEQREIIDSYASSIVVTPA